MNPLEKTHHREAGPHLVRELVRTYQALMSGFTREVGMPASRLAVMRLLAISPDAQMGVVALARQLEIHAAAVTRQLQEMEKGGLVQRRADSHDRRRIHFGLTSKGRKLFAEIHDRSHRLESTLTIEIGASKMATAATVLVQLRTYIEKLNDIHRKGNAR